MSDELAQPPKPSGQPMDAQAMKAGLLFEAADAHQQMATAALKRLDAATRALEPSVRDAVEQVVAQVVAETAKAEFAQLRAEVQRTSQAMQSVRSGMTWNLGLLACTMAAVAAVTMACGIYLLGGFTSVANAAELAAAQRLRGDPSVLAEAARRGLKVDVAFCGDARGENRPENRRLCVKVDPKAGSFGPRKDHMVLPAP